MYGRIVVPVDGSKLAERAAALAVPLAEQHGARLMVLHAHTPMLPLFLGGAAPVRDTALEQDQRQEQARYVTRLAKRLAKQTSAAVEDVFRDGPVVETIMKVATEGRAPLIVMSTHGRGGFKRFWLGSVADRLIRHATVPVLLLTGSRSTGKRLAGTPVFKHVLVTLDGSDRAEAALRAARALLAGVPGRITVAHVVHPMSALAATSLERDPEQVMVESYLEPLLAAQRGPGLTLDYDVVVDGNVARAILEVAKRSDVGAIAITSQGLAGVQRLVVGSVADKLIRTSPVPVLVCPGATTI